MPIPDSVDIAVAAAESAATSAELAALAAANASRDVSGAVATATAQAETYRDEAADAAATATAPTEAMVGALTGVTVAEPTGTNDTAAIQAALDAVSTAGGGTVRLRPGRVYKVQQAGTIALRNASGTTNPTAGYCLKLPSNVTLDAQGATIRLNSGDTRVLVNASPDQPAGTASDTNITVANVTLDANAVQFTNAQLATFVGVRNLTLRHVRVTNGKGGGILIYNAQGGTFDDLDLDTWAGNPLTLGNPTPANVDVRDARIGTIRARDIAADTVNPDTFPGNPIYAALTRCTLGEILAVNTAGGYKFDAGSDNTLGRAIIKGGPLATLNSGLKIQGYDANTRVRRLVVGEVIAQGCYGSGLYIDQYTEDVTVTSYTGDGNVTTSSAPDVWLAGLRNTILAIRSNNTGLQALQVRPDAVDWHVGRIRIHNPGHPANATATKNAIGVAAPAAGRIGDLVAIDDRAGSAQMTRGLSIDVAAVVEVGAADVRGATGVPIAINAAAAARIGPVRTHATDPMAGEVTLTAGTSTNVTNGNLRNDNFGGYMRTIVRLTPLNSAARTIAGGGLVYVVPGTGAMTIKHPAATGSEVFRWEAVGLAREAINIT